MSVQFRSVSLIDESDSKYQEHCKNMQLIRNCNRFIGEPDYKQVITAWLEAVIIQHLSSTFIFDKRNILTWEELSNYNQYSRRYREIDGLFSSNDGLIYIEVKASLSKSNFQKGKTQINDNLKLLASISKQPRAVLILADCRCFDPTFGYAKEFIEEKKATSDVYKNIEGMNFPTSLGDSSKWLWLLNQDEVQTLAALYGPPNEEELQPEY